MPETKKILLIEDDQMIVRLYEHKLVKDGFAVTVAFNGEEGLAALAKDRPDIVLLDIMMPKMNGLEALGRIKSDPQYKDLPAVILTNLGDRSDDIEHCKKLGADDYWVKVNINIEELAGNINKILANRAGGSS